MFDEWLWAWQFGAGIFLGYYCLSPRLRRTINAFVLYYLPRPTRAQPRQQPQPIDPVRATLRDLLKAPQVDVRPHGHILVSEEELAKWLRANPDLKITVSKEK